MPRIVRLTAPIFPQDDFERAAFAAAYPDEIIAHVTYADVVALISAALAFLVRWIVRELRR